MKHSSLSLIGFMALSLSACSTYTEGAQQKISFTTIAAEGAICEVKTGENERLYIVRPPQTIWIKKSRHDLAITCQAPGNRVATQSVESEIAATTFLNPLNGILPGAVYDGESGAMFKYPESIAIDFTNIHPSITPMPGYHNLDGLDSRLVNTIENYGPDTPKLLSDTKSAASHKMAWEAYNHEQAQEAAMEAEKQSRMNAIDGGFYGDKGK